VAPNVLARRFAVPAPDTARVTGITYLWTHEGWLYLAVILDLFSRAVVGWALSARITRHLPLQALTMALGRRRPPQGLLHHSDRGSQYASGDYRRALAAHGIVCSMSRRGNCWDNAVAESFFATVKVELAHDADWMTRAQARSEVFEYLERFSNGQRRHSALGYQSPITFERQWATECGTTAAAASQPIAGRSAKNASLVEAPGSTRTRGVAISVSPSAPSAVAINLIPGTLEAAPPTAVGTRATCLITP
jgi:transposase InsO family protein